MLGNDCSPPGRVCPGLPLKAASLPGFHVCVCVFVCVCGVCVFVCVWCVCVCGVGCACVCVVCMCGVCVCVWCVCVMGAVENVRTAPFKVKNPSQAN